MDEQVYNAPHKGHPVAMHPQVVMLNPVPPRSLREERLKDVHLKPVHVPLKREEESITGEH